MKLISPREIRLNWLALQMTCLCLFGMQKQFTRISIHKKTTRYNETLLSTVISIKAIIWKHSLVLESHKAQLCNSHSQAKSLWSLVCRWGIQSATDYENMLFNCYQSLGDCSHVRVSSQAVELFFCDVLCRIMLHNLCETIFYQLIIFNRLAFSKSSLFSHSLSSSLITSSHTKKKCQQRKQTVPIVYVPSSAQAGHLEEAKYFRRHIIAYNAWL